MGYLFGQKRRKVGRLAAGRSMLSRHAGSVQRGAWHVVLAARGADRKTAADGIRAVIDESSCAVGWCAADQASRSQQSRAAGSRLPPCFPKIKVLGASSGPSCYVGVLD
jgi:hypothetical protein